MPFIVYFLLFCFFMILHPPNARIYVQFRFARPRIYVICFYLHLPRLNYKQLIAYHI